MSTYQIRKSSLLDTRTNSTPSNVLNTTDVSLNTTNLESYKKALHSIVRRLNKTPTSSSKTTIKKLESKLNQTQQPLYNTFLSSSQTSKKHFMSPNAKTKHQSAVNRSVSNERSPYKHSKEILEKSLQESYFRKESLASNLMNSVSVNKLDRNETTIHEDLYDDKLRGDSILIQDHGLNATMLSDNNMTRMDTEGDYKLKELVQKYQLRDSAYKQEVEQLKKANDTLKAHVFDLEMEVEKINKNRDLERKYVGKLEEENSQLKERLQQEEIEKKSLTAIMAENKEKQYLKIIEDLKAQVNNLTSEKKLVEHLLKSSLMQKEPVKEALKEDKKLSNGILNTLDSSTLAVTSCKYVNSKERVKTTAANYTKKPLVTESFNDENDYASHSLYQQHPANSSFVSMSLKLDKELMSLKEIKQPQQQQQVNTSLNFGKIIRVNESVNAGAIADIVTVEHAEEGDEPFPKKVFHPRTNERSLKERIDMNQFRLDLTRISKNRKAD